MNFQGKPAAKDAGVARLAALQEHVLRELNLYFKFVAEGSYLIVNDRHREALGIMGPDKEGAC